MKRKDIALTYLARMLLRIPLPITKKWGVSIATRILARYVVESINNYRKALDIMNTGELKDNPFWQIGCGLSAILALMPATIIYSLVKDSTTVKDN